MLLSALSVLDILGVPLLTGGIMRLFQNPRKVRNILIGIGIFIMLTGVLSWTTASGHAVIGPDPVSVAAQREGIAYRTLIYTAIIFAMAGIAHVVHRKGKR